MKTLTVLALWLLIFTVAVLAQPSPGTLWRHTYSPGLADDSKAVVQLADGNYLVTGGTRLSDNRWQPFVMKVDSATGAPIYSRIISATGSNGTTELLLDEPPFAFLAGTKQNGPFGSFDYWLLRVNTDTGDTLWTRCYGTVRNDQLKGIVRMADGGLLLAGATYFPGEYWDTPNPLIVRLDAVGDPLWQQHYPNSEREAVTGVAATPDTGFVLSTCSCGNYMELYWCNGLLKRFTGAGTLRWSVPTGTEEGFDEPGVVVTIAGNSYVFGYTYRWDVPFTEYSHWAAGYNANGASVAFHRYYMADIPDQGACALPDGDLIHWGGIAGFMRSGHSLDSLWYLPATGTNLGLVTSVCPSGTGGFIVLQDSLNDIMLTRTGTDPRSQAPVALTIQVVDSTQMRLTWQPLAYPHFRIYSAPSLTGPYNTLVGSTTDTTFLAPAAPAHQRRFFRVVGSTEP